MTDADKPSDVFRALADPTRRALLDRLFERDGQSVGELAAGFAGMTRFGVMKHLGVLTDAALVTTARRGRQRLAFLNPVPIAEIAHRWIARYAAGWTDSLVDLRRQIEHPPLREDPTTMSDQHVYLTYIAATPETVWAAITESDWTRRYFHGTAFVEPPTQGEPYATVMPDGSPAVDGMVEELRPPTGDEPGRFVVTWHIDYDDALAAEPAGRVEWTIEGAGPGLTRVRLVHGDLADSPLTFDHVGEGWSWVLDSLKTLLETGTTLPRAS